MDPTYCVKCKTVTENTNSTFQQTKSGSYLMRSTCAKCGSNKTRFITKAHKNTMAKEL